MPKALADHYNAAMTSVLSMPDRETAALDDSGYESLHPNARLSWIFGSVIGWSILALVVSVVEVSLLRRSATWPWPWFVPAFSVAGACVVVPASVGMAILRFRRFGYRLREKDLVVRSGVIWRSWRCIPRSRIQHVDIDSGPIDRSLGLVEVKLYVAGGMGAVAELPGLSPHAADELKEALLVARTDGV